MLITTTHKIRAVLAVAAATIVATVGEFRRRSVSRKCEHAPHGRTISCDGIGAPPKASQVRRRSGACRRGDRRCGGTWSAHR